MFITKCSTLCIFAIHCLFLLILIFAKGTSGLNMQCEDIFASIKKLNTEE